MTLTRNQFFLVALLICLVAAFSYKVWWFVTSKEAVGEVYFIGHGNLGSSLGISTYEVIRFTANCDTIIFNNNLYLHLKVGQPVRILYQSDNPEDAKVNTFKAMWAEPLIYSLWPIVVLIVFYLMPEVFPKKAKVVLGGKKFISIKV